MNCNFFYAAHAIKDLKVCKLLQILVHEVRRDIYYRKVNHAPTEHQDVRRKAYMITVIKKTSSYLLYLDENRWRTEVHFVDKLIELIQNDLN